MPSAVLIANPSASQFTGGAFRQIRSTLDRAFDLRTEWPISPHETSVASRLAAESGHDVVFAMGGDGVAHHVANALVGTETALGLIPVGTTNVLARIFGIPSKAAKAAEFAVDAPSTPTRVVRIDAETAIGSFTRYGTFSIGVGFDADVVELAETRPFAKSRFGSLHYASTALGRLVSNWRSERPNLRIACDGERFDAVVALTQVHDPYTFFGRVPLRLSPDAVDGLATLAADNLGVSRSAEILTRATVGARQRPATGVRLFAAYERLEIEADPPAPFQADGELLGYASSISLSPIEGALLVLRSPEPAAQD